MVDQHAPQPSEAPTDPGRAAREQDAPAGTAWATSPSVMPGPPAPDPPLRLLAAAAAGGAVSALIGAFLLHRWFKKRGWLS